MEINYDVFLENIVMTFHYDKYHDYTYNPHAYYGRIYYLDDNEEINYIPFDFGINLYEISEVKESLKWFYEKQINNQSFLIRKNNLFGIISNEKIVFFDDIKSKIIKDKIYDYFFTKTCFDISSDIKVIEKYIN